MGAVRVAKNALWLSICRCAADLSSVVLFALISRRLGPVAAGEYSYAFALGVFAAIIAASGLDQYGIRKFSQTPSSADQQACWQGMLSAQALQLLCGIALLAILVLLLGSANANPLITLELAAFLICWALSRMLFVPATAHEAMVVPALIECACRSGASLSAGVLCLAGVESLPVMLLGFPAAGIVLVGAAVRNARHHGAQFNSFANWSDTRSIIRRALPLTVCDALGQFYIRADLLLIVQLLGSASAGWYATDLKMVEVGVMPLILLGTAAYPLLSRAVASSRGEFLKLSVEFIHTVLFMSGWLAVVMYCLLPLAIPALFGHRFQPAVGVLPIFSMLAVAKGLEIGLCRLLFATKRQNTYVAALIIGTSLIVALNLWLIPNFRMSGAVAAVVLGSVVVDLVAMRSLRSDLRPAMFLAALARLGLPLAATAIVFATLSATPLNDWSVAVIACLVFPALGSLSGLMPNPRRSLLFA